jgi:thiol-disulfide isomerase/thioredoxin
MKKTTLFTTLFTALCAVLCVTAAAQTQTQTTMDEVRASILRDVGDTTERTAKPSDAPDFFGHGKARIVGYLKGYDTARHKFSTVRFQLENILTREAIPFAAELTPDGWFTADIPLEYPKRVRLYIGNYAFPIYLEQESRLGVIIDMADPKLIEFIGPLARLNRELHSFEPERFRYRAFTEAMERAAAMAPTETVDYFREFRDRNLSALDSLTRAGTISDDACRLLRYVEYDYFGQLLGDFEMKNKQARSEDPEKPKLPVEFYSFLNDIPMNDPGLLTTGEWVFINRYEFMAPLWDISLFRMSPDMADIDRWRIEDRRRDSVCYEVLGLSPSLLYEITKVRRVNSRLKEERKLDYCRVVSDAVHHPFLKDEVWRMYEQSLPRPEDGNGYVLPAGQATDVLKAITDPHLGNFVLIDFWGTGCGPCVSHIKSDREQRDRLAKEGVLTYVFISDDSWSPSAEHYDRFVEEQGLTNHHRLTTDDMNRFNQLFKFSSMPHYVLLGPDGRVLDDDFSPWGDTKLSLEKYTK